MERKFFILQPCTADQQLKCFQELDQLVKKVNNFVAWREANKKSPLSEFFTGHIAGIIKDQFAVIRKLFSYSAEAQHMFQNL